MESSDVELRRQVGVDPLQLQQPADQAVVLAVQGQHQPGAALAIQPVQNSWLSLQGPSTNISYSLGLLLNMIFGFASIF